MSTSEAMLLFLDFDGVVHPIVGQTFDNQCIRLINSALEGQDIDIVITSTWRENYPLTELREMLGKDLGDKVVGVTPVIDDPFLQYVRYHEVLSYLSKTGQVTRVWVGLDDTKGFYPPDAPVVWCNPHTGFTEAEAQELRRLLLSSTSVNP